MARSTKATRSTDKRLKENYTIKRREEAKKRAEVMRSNNPMNQPIELDEGTSSDAINFILETVPVPQDRAVTLAERQNVPLLKERFENYLKKCAKYDQRISNLGAYAAMGLNYDLVADYIQPTNKHKERREFLLYVKQVCSMYRESLMAHNQLSPPVGIFWQKNFDGLRDVQEYTVRPEVEEQKTREQLEKKYLEVAEAEYTEHD